MTKRPAPDDGSAATRFKKGQSGNPKGRPRKPKPPPPSPFAILDEPLTVHEPDGVSQLRLEDAMLLKTYQLAISGGRRAQKKIVKMMLERHKAAVQGRASRGPRIQRLIEPDPATMDLADATRVLGGGAGLVPGGTMGIATPYPYSYTAKRLVEESKKHHIEAKAKIDHANAMWKAKAALAQAEAAAAISTP